MRPRPPCGCGRAGAFAYRDLSGALVWYCTSHRLAEHWADSRADLAASGHPDKGPKGLFGQPAPIGPPDLQQLIAAYRDYSEIPPAAWAEFDRQTSKNLVQMLQPQRKTI